MVRRKGAKRMEVVSNWMGVNGKVVIVGKRGKRGLKGRGVSCGKYTMEKGKLRGQ